MSDPVFHTGSRKAPNGGIKRLIHSAAITLSCLLLIWLLSAAVPHAPKDLAGNVGRAALMAENDTAPAPLSVRLVHSSGDAWGAGEAQRLAELMAERFSVSCTVSDDLSYGELDAVEQRADLTVSLGHTLLNAESYLEALERLGTDGLEITAGMPEIPSPENNAAVSAQDAAQDLPETVFITAFTHDKAREGADRLLDCFFSNGSLFHILNRLYTSEPAADACPPVIRAEAGQTASVLVVSAPGDDDYSLFTLSRMLDEAGAAPSLVIFNGGLDCGASDRRSLCAAWDRIASLLESRSVPWCFTLSATEKLPRELIAEVLSSYPGCLTSADAGSLSACVVLTCEKTPLCCFLLTDPLDLADPDDAGRLCRYTERWAAAAARAGCPENGFAAVLPGLPERYAAVLPSAGGADPLYGAADLCDVLDALGTDFLLCRGESTDASLTTEDGICRALLGSVDFGIPGLGGRFDRNNRLRGGAVLTAAARRAGYAEYTARYLTAEELGTNHK